LGNEALHRDNTVTDALKVIYFVNKNNSCMTCYLSNIVNYAFAALTPLVQSATTGGASACKKTCGGDLTGILRILRVPVVNRTTSIISYSTKI